MRKEGSSMEVFLSKGEGRGNEGERAIRLKKKNAWMRNAKNRHNSIGHS